MKRLDNKSGRFLLYLFLMPCKKLLLFFHILLITSCIPHGAFVTQPPEPLLIQNKNEHQFSMGLRAFKYLSCDYAYSPVQNFAFKTHAGGTVGLINTNITLLYYNHFKRLNYHIGGLYNFEYNNISREYGSIMGTSFSSYFYDCVFNSVGASVGLGLNSKSQLSQLHLGFKCQYNMVDHYVYEILFEDRYSASTNESLNYKIPDFFNYEPYFAIVWKNDEKQKCYYKVQLGLNIVQVTYNHHYIARSSTFYGYSYTLDKTYKHPASLPINLSFAFIFHKSKGYKPYNPNEQY
jgi:hypothetical protein